MVVLCGPVAVRAARRMRPQVAGRILLILRLLPATLALLIVAGVCVPSFLWLEPEAGVEEVGVACLAAAIMGAALWTISTVRGVRAALRSARHAESCEQLGRLSFLPGSSRPVRILDVETPMLALVGLFRSRVVITPPVMSALTRGQLNAALRHEDAHRASRDNLKRLLMVLAPGLLPGFRGFGRLEQGWARFTEWAADDAAVAGNPRLSVALAAALVRIARMGGVPAPAPLTASFLGDSREISARVDRLLRPAQVAPAASRYYAGVVAALCAGCAALLLNASTFESAHRIIEKLIH